MYIHVASFLNSITMVMTFFHILLQLLISLLALGYVHHVFAFRWHNCYKMYLTWIPLFVSYRFTFCNVPKGLYHFGVFRSNCVATIPNQCTSDCVLKMTNACNKITYEMKTKVQLFWNEEPFSHVSRNSNFINGKCHSEECRIVIPKKRNRSHRRLSHTN